MLISAEFFETIHGKMDCRYCHGGKKFARTRAAAHEGMEPLPSSKYARSVCAPCHKPITDKFSTNLHAETRGISSPTKALVLKRADSAGTNLVKQGLKNNCNACHVSGCGDCHVSRPQFNEGGFVEGHVFYKSPQLINCTGCHGSRVEKEYTGKGDGTKTVLQADVHWSSGGMKCTRCHTAKWIHGGEVYDSRRDSPQAPKCVNCHEQDSAFLASQMHSQHATPDSKAFLQCQVCHAQDYNNCTSCHVALDGKRLPYFTTESSGFDFNIGRNSSPDATRPWDYVVVRHVPVSESTFDFYGKGALGKMSAEPTWKYATPHSILRVTRQTKRGCASCHGNRDIFLTQDDLEGLTATETEANRSVIVTRVPQQPR